MTLLSVSPWGLLAAIAAAAVVGFAWYSPFAFAPAWSRRLGLSPQEMKKGPPPATWFVMLLSQAGGAFVLASLRAMLGLASTLEMITLACLLFFCVYGFSTLTSALFGKKNLVVWLIEAGGALVVLVVQAIVLSFF